VSCELRSYIPLRTERLFGHRNGNMIIGVIEVVQDLTDDYRATLRLEAMIAVTSTAFLALLFVILRFIVARADRIMRERIEERRRLEERLHQSERLAALGKMVTSVAHEIKNPLGIVQSTAGILRKKMAGDMPEYARLAGIIVDEAARLDGVVREFLDFARPRPMNFSRVEVNRVLEQVLSFLAPELEKRGVALDRALDARLPAAGGDADRLYRAFLNVLMNAVQAMEEDGGVLSVRTRRTGDGRIEVEIGDTGVGMDEETLRQIFTPFFTGRSRGTGLGLAIVRNIVEAHGGAIEVHSHPGEGSTFRITLAPWREDGPPQAD
jgi:signal transduction histidine kinase